MLKHALLVLNAALCAAALPLATSVPSVPATMTAVYKDAFICQTPFACIQTHTVAVPKPAQGQVNTLARCPRLPGMRHQDPSWLRSARSARNPSH